MLTPSQLLALSLGQHGHDIIPATGVSPAIAGAGNYTHVTEWVAIVAIDADAEVEAADANGTATIGNHTLDGTEPNDDKFVTLSHDAVILGRITEIRVDTGSIVKAYRNPVAE